MSIFPHEDPNFGGIVADVADSKRIGAGLVDKEYWVTHVLWALNAAGLEVRFKGGTCLSKGYGLIERFSEDLDLQLGPGTSDLPEPPNWRGDKPSQIAKRQAWFEALQTRLSIPGCRVEINVDLEDERARSAVFEVHYPGALAQRLGPLVSPWVRLEVGVARTTPALLRPITSWVHDEIDARSAWAGLVDNRPPPVHCVHPAVTLLEKIDAISRRWTRGDLPARSFVRHYEDAARIVGALPTLPPVPGGLDILVAEMIAERQLRLRPSVDDPALVLAPGERTDEVRAAWEDLRPLFWGERVALHECCAQLRGWIVGNIAPS
jgi:Nucleotidyl transferase AbiEii toxin, Type IV TA system